MEIILKGDSKEIAAFVLAVQERQEGEEEIIFGAPYNPNMSPQKKETRMYSCEISFVFETMPANIVLRKIKKIAQENGGEFLEYKETEKGRKKTYSRGFYKLQDGQGSNPASLL